MITVASANPKLNYEVNRTCLEHLPICFLNPISSFSSGCQQSPADTTYAQDPTLNAICKAQLPCPMLGYLPS